MLIIIILLLMVSIYSAIVSFVPQLDTAKTHLPDQMISAPKAPAKKKDGGTAPIETWNPFSKRYKHLDKKLRLPFDLRHRIIKAGTPLGVLEFLGIQVLSVVGVPIFGYMVVGEGFLDPVTIFCSIAFGAFMPWLWLSSKIKKRQLQMRKDMPSLIDLLNICVSGGLDFMMAVSRVVRDMKSCELTRELAEMQREVQMGIIRREALRSLAWRIDMPEMYSFVRTLVQADRMGTSIGEALKIQADELRTRRFQRGEELALKAPIKLLFPMIFCILPVIILIVVGPVFLNFIRGDLIKLQMGVLQQQQEKQQQQGGQNAQNR